MPEYLIPLIKLVEWCHSSEAQPSRVCVVIYVDLEKYQPSAVVSIIKIQHVHKQEKWAEVKKLSFCQVTDCICVIVLFFLVEDWSVEAESMGWCRGQKVKKLETGPERKPVLYFAFPVTIKGIIFDNPLAIFVLLNSGVNAARQFCASGRLQTLRSARS